MLNYLSTLSSTQYTFVLYGFIATALLMAVSAAFFVFSRRKFEAAYRPALWMVAAIVGMSALHYLFLFTQWRGAYTLQGELYAPTKDALRVRALPLRLLAPRRATAAHLARQRARLSQGASSFAQHPLNGSHGCHDRARLPR